MDDRPVEQALAATFAQVPYPGCADAETHVRNLEALALLFGMSPAPITDCRVLELACAAGWNLLPQAAALPHSRWVGIDLAAGQIAAGQELVRTLGWEHVELRAGSILDIDDGWGRFDYILCAGVYSWVPPEVQDKILAVCRAHLKPHGVAVVTYNVYPGWHFQETVRDLMRYHVRAIADPGRQIAQARAILEFMSEHGPPGTTPTLVWRAERDFLRTMRDYYLYHEYLVEHNRPVYFHEFVARAAGHGLQFVADGNLAKMHGVFMPPAVQEVLARTPLVQQCQLLDFFRGESFHRTLLCHREVALQRPWHAAAFARLQLTLPAPPKPAEFDIASREPLGLQFPQGTLTTHAPLGKAALRCLLAARPQALGLDDLQAAALAALPAAARAPADEGAAGQRTLAQAMFGAAAAGIVRLAVHPPQFCTTLSPRPLATPLVRAWAARKTPLVNQRHENILLNDLQNRVLSCLDGQHDRPQVEATVQQAVAGGELAVDTARETLPTQIDNALAELCRQALLVG